VRVRAVVHAGRVRTRVHEDRHEDGRHERDRQGECREGTRRPQQPDDQDRDQRPQQVELLLDRERPEVDEQLRGGLVRVGGPRRDLQPVRRERERAEDLPADVDHEVALDDRGDRHRHDDHEEQRRQQSPGTPLPEGGEVDPAALGDLAQQERGDEEAREDEEQVDSHEAARQQSGEHVEDEDGDDRQGPDAVEAGHPAAAHDLTRRHLGSALGHRLSIPGAHPPTVRLAGVRRGRPGCAHGRTNGPDRGG
jgi:hypothetical protein